MKAAGLSKEGRQSPAEAAVVEWWHQRSATCPVSTHALAHVTQTMSGWVNDSQDDLLELKRFFR